MVFGLTPAATYRLNPCLLQYGASNKQLTSFVLETARVFDAHNVSYWLDDGTLLGALRDGGLILSDYDADISILGDEREMKRAFLALKAGLSPHLRAEICYYIGHPKQECNGEWVWDDLPPRVPDLYLNALNIEVCEAHAAECHNPDLDIFPCSVSPDGELVGSTSRLHRSVYENFKLRHCLGPVLTSRTFELANPAPPYTHAPGTLMCLLPMQIGLLIARCLEPLINLILVGAPFTVPVNTHTHTHTFNPRYHASEVPSTGRTTCIRPICEGFLEFICK